MADKTGHLKEVALLFLKLGVTAFGGPAAHIAMMRDDIVRRRQWLSDHDFLDMVGATNLIPGPNSTEIAIHLGYRRGGWPGLVLAGTLFIVPAMLMVLAMAVLYVEYGSTPAADALLYGIKPVIIAIVAQALWGLSRTAIKGPVLAVVGAAVLALYLLGINELILLFAGGAFMALLRLGQRVGLPWVAVLVPLPLFASPLAAISLQQAASFSMTTLFLTFLKIGAVLYGSGYVLLAFLHGDFVERLSWLTGQQLIDAVAIGQFTPGPVSTTATFVGYIAGGYIAAIVATVAIFLPTFAFVALLSKILPLARRSPVVGVALDGINVASLGPMAGVTYQLGRAAVVDFFTAVLAIAALVVVLRTKLNSAWIVLGGAALGFAGYSFLAGWP